MSVTTHNAVPVAPPSSSASLATRRRSLLATGVGNVLEWFDWAVYGVFSTYIANALFNANDPASALLATLAVFAVGFVMRPLGGYIFGRIADKRGRKWVLLVTMLLMATGSVIIALIPSYESIGGLASLLLLLARLLQGFAHGGESTASNVYLPEIAPRKHRALYSSAVGVAMALGTMLATLFGSVLANNFDSDFMNEWGWRIPFLFGGLLAVAVLWLRRNMMESEVHEAQETEETTTSATLRPAVDWTRRQIAVKALETFVYMSGTTLPYYVWSSFAATYAISQKGMDPAGAFTASLGAMAIHIALIPVVGIIADKFGRRLPVIIYALTTAGLTVPAFAVISDNPWTLFAVQGLMMALLAAIGGTQPAMLAEQIPTKYRTLIMGISMPLAVALFGGTAPYLNTWLASQGLSWIFDVYIIALTLGTAYIVAFRWKETKGIDLTDLR